MEMGEPGIAASENHFMDTFETEEQNGGTSAGSNGLLQKTLYDKNRVTCSKSMVH